MSAASAAVARAAAGLRSQAGPLHVLTGLRLVEARTGQWLGLDLVVITDRAVAVGVEARSGAPAGTSPQAAALAVVRLQRERGLDPALPVYAFWLGSAPPGYAGGAPSLADAAAVQRFLEQVQTAPAAGSAPAAETAAALAEYLRQMDVIPLDEAAEGGDYTLPARPKAVSRPGGSLRRLLRGVRDLPARFDAGVRAQLLTRLRQSWRFGRRVQPVRPADVREQLEAALFAPENWLEDASFLKIVPNDFVIELSPHNYEQNYRLIEQRLCAQWQERLIAALNTANQRQGRRQYQFGGPVQVRVRAGLGLADDQVRLRSRIALAPEAGEQLPCLALWPAGRRWPLPRGTRTLGRDPAADIYLEAANVRDQPLVSGLHAYVNVESGQARLFDGSPAGRASLNGTFVNGQRVPPDGHPLAEGDVIVLAPLDPRQPDPNTPGTLALVYHARCRP